jgi:hypothetical protein
LIENSASATTSRLGLIGAVNLHEAMNAGFVRAVVQIRLVVATRHRISSQMTSTRNPSTPRSNRSAGHRTLIAGQLRQLKSGCSGENNKWYWPVRLARPGQPPIATRLWRRPSGLPFAQMYQSRLGLMRDAFEETGMTFGGGWGESRMTLILHACAAATSRSNSRAIEWRIDHCNSR